MQRSVKLSKLTLFLIIVSLIINSFFLAACSDNATPIAPVQASPATTTATAATTLNTTLATTSVVVSSTTTTATAVTTEVPVADPTAPLTKAVTDTVTAPSLGSAEAALQATGFDGNEAKQWLDDLTQKIGPRVVGTDGEKQAASWLESHYKDFGYTQVTEQSFPFAVPELRQGIIFSGDQPNQTTVKTQGLLLSKPFVTKFQATIVQYTPGTDVKDKIVVLADSSDFSVLKPQIDTLAQNGAKAVLIPRMALQPDYKTFADETIPVLVVPFQTIANLQPSAGTVTLQTTYVAGRQGNGTNVIVTRSSTTPDAPILIFGGHYDTVKGSVGANDNASGTVTVLELAKVLFKQFPNYELRFVNFSGAETGLNGSFYYVSKLSDDEKKRITAYINLDFVGVGDKFVATGTKDLVDQAVSVAKQNNVDLQSFDFTSVGVASDYYAFTNNNIKALSLDRWQDPMYRKTYDTPDRVFPQALTLAGGTAILVADKLAGK